jgi:hypothetical protein
MPTRPSEPHRVAAAAAQFTLGADGRLSPRRAGDDRVGAEVLDAAICALAAIVAEMDVFGTDADAIRRRAPPSARDQSGSPAQRAPERRSSAACR